MGEGFDRVSAVQVSIPEKREIPFEADKTCDALGDALGFNP